MDGNQFLFYNTERIFADSVLCRKITALEREQLLSQLSSVHRVDLFTRDENASVGSCCNHGYIDYTTEMPKVFAGSRINLNITLKSIRHGIPLRAMEIMGAGGFLLTNYQSDFLMHFDAQKDFVYYEDMNDAIEKAMYYLRTKTNAPKLPPMACRKSERHIHMKSVLMKCFHFFADFLLPTKNRQALTAITQKARITYIRVFHAVSSSFVPHFFTSSSCVTSFTRGETDGAACCFCSS